MRWMWVWLGMLLPVSGFSAGSPKCEVSVDGVSFSLSQTVNPQRDLKKILGFLKGFAASREIVESFSDRLTKRETHVRPFYQREDLPPQTVAFFDLESHSLHVKTGELGVLAVNFFHEMVHSNDDDFAKRVGEWQRNPEDRTKHRMVFAAERLAYDHHRKLLLEIFKSNGDCAEKYFLHHESEKNIVVREVPDADLAEHYQLNPEWIK